MAWIVPIVTAAYGAYAGNKARQRSKDEQKRQEALAAPARSRQEEMLKMLQPYGQGMLNSGQQNMGLVESYLRNQLSGDRGRTMQSVAPEINAFADQARGSVAAQRMGAPRGGATAAAGADIPRQFQSGVNNLLFSVRPRAAEQLGQLGSAQSNVGLGALGQGSGLTNSMLQYGLDARQLGLQQQQLMLQQGQAMGQGLGGISQLLQTYINNRQSAQPTSPYTAVQQPNPWAGANTSKGIMGSSPYSNYGIYSMPGKST